LGAIFLNYFYSLVLGQLRLATKNYATCLSPFSPFAGPRQFAHELGETAAQNGQHQATMRKEHSPPRART
jgi:hypothetical protein